MYEAYQAQISPRLFRRYITAGDYFGEKG